MKVPHRALTKDTPQALRSFSWRIRTSNTRFLEPGERQAAIEGTDVCGAGCAIARTDKPRKVSPRKLPVP